MPTPPALAKDFEYSSVSIERHTPVPGVSPNGPSPLMPDVICENIEFKNTDSKSCAAPLAFSCVCGDTFFSDKSLPGMIEQIAAQHDEAYILHQGLVVAA